MRGIAAAALLGIATIGGAAAEEGSSTPLACIANGQSYAPGEIACVPGCHGQQRLARCDVVGLTVGWTVIANDCPSASLTPIPLPGQPTQIVCLPMRPGVFELRL